MEENLNTEIHDTLFITLSSDITSSGLIFIGYILFLIGTIILARKPRALSSKVMLSGAVLFLISNISILFFVFNENELSNRQSQILSLLDIAASLSVAIIGFGFLKHALEKNDK